MDNPSTRRGIRVRNVMFSTAFLFAPLMMIADRFARDVKLEDYTNRAS